MGVFSYRLESAGTISCRFDLFDGLRQWGESQLLMNHKMDEAERTEIHLKTLFGDDLGIEVQPNNMKRGSNIFNDEIDQFFLNRQLINLGKKHNIRVVAACNTHYLTKEEADVHDVFLGHWLSPAQVFYLSFALSSPRFLSEDG